MDMIKAENVLYTYEDGDTQILQGISLAVRKGEFLCILGHNGSGKSTLAKLLGGLFTPTGGKVEVCGMDTSDEKNEINVRKNVGMVFQNPDNQIVATIVEDDVAFGPENLGLPREEIRKRVDKALEITDMTAFKKSEPHKLSGGQKQRIAIAGMLAMRPEILILDEPTAMLDPMGRREVMRSVESLCRNDGMTVVHITHFMEEAILADRVAVMSEGQIIMQGTPREVFSQQERLRELALDVPQMTSLAHSLIRHGADLPPDILTIEELADRICPSR